MIFPARMTQHLRRTVDLTGTQSWLGRLSLIHIGTSSSSSSCVRGRANTTLKKQTWGEIILSRLISFKYDFKYARVIERIRFVECISRSNVINNLFLISLQILLYYYCLRVYTYTFRNLVFLNDDPLLHYFLYFARELLYTMLVTLNRLGLELFKEELLKFNSKLLCD